MGREVMPHANSMHGCVVFVVLAERPFTGFCRGLHSVLSRRDEQVSLPLFIMQWKQNWEVPTTLTSCSYTFMVGRIPICLALMVLVLVIASFALTKVNTYKVDRTKKYRYK